MKRAVFPARGSVVTRKIECSPRSEGESDAAYAERLAWCEALSAVEIDVVMLDRSALVALGHKYALWGATETRRKRDAEAAGTVTAGLTVEGAAELRALQVETVVAQVRMVRGLTVGAGEDMSVDSEDLTGEALASLIDAAGLLADVASIARAAQSPTPQQLER